MKTVLITGHKGFVGSHLTEHLSQVPGIRIVGFDIKDSPRHDMRDLEAVSAFMAEHKPDVVIHLGANPDVPTSIERPYEDAHLNIVGTAVMLEAARKHGVDQFLFASTAQVYGAAGGVMHEDLPRNPKSPYAIGKVAAERYVQFYHETHGLNTCIFRFFNIYGEGQLEWTVIPSLITRMSETPDGPFRMYGSRKDTRDFIYVKDICKAFELAIEKEVSGEILNLASGKETKILYLAQTIAGLLGKRFEYVYDESPHAGKLSRMRADISRTREILGWKPTYSLNQGLVCVVLRKKLLVLEQRVAA